MSDATVVPFHTATIEHRVPGQPVEMAALAYNLQYTQPLVEELVDGNPPTRTHVQSLRVGGRDLVRLNLYGSHPGGVRRRICVIGISDQHEGAERAAQQAWFEYHASVLFSGEAGEEAVHKLAFQHRVPGLPAQRASTVGVAFELDYLKPLVQTAVGRNAPTYDDLQVVHSGELTLMRVNLYGLHPARDQPADLCRRDRRSALPRRRCGGTGVGRLPHLAPVRRARARSAVGRASA